ncbi:cold shock domain-containing protein [Flavobacterium filum]|uniref:cold shock domain-containing protein n=1 Tax=Flavobacterium filum TaxID=370974 RepID=UPI0023F006B1|nr:cold shock domain-containing protein [Flavobacterium filum]
MADKEKYIGLVKWFHDQARDANYGFIQHAKLGDLFFHERSIEQGQDIKSFRENAIVVFVSQESKKHKGKLEAVEVKYLDNETDLNFLFSHFLSILTEKGKYSDYNTIQKGVHTKINSLLEKSTDKQIIEQLFERFQKYINEQIHSNSITDEEYLKGLLKVGKGFFPNNYRQVTDIVEKNISVELAHKLWLESFIETCQINYVADIILSESEPTKQKIFSRCSANDFEQLLEPFKRHIIEKIHSNIPDKEFENILKVGKIFFSTNYNQITGIVEKNISVELAHKLWLESFIETCQIDYVANIILSETEQTQRRILNRSSEDDKTNIFFKVLYTIDRIDTEAKFKSIKQLLSLSKTFASEQYEKILAETIKNCPDYFKLSLWLEDYHEILDFHSYKLYTVTLLPKDQKRFVKKVLKYIHEEKANISIEDLTSLNVMDFATSKLAEQIDNSNLDYSTSIILNVISELKSQTNLETRKDVTSAQYRIYDLIIKQIQQPKDILHISGFFDECEGRCSVSVHEVKNEAGEITNRNVTYNRNEHNKAKNHPICDGRKAISKTTKETVLSDEKVEFWWCANQKCFKPSRQLHSSTDWEKYSLLDFLTILKVDFKESDLEIYLNIINKANRFLKHLNCRKCNHILYPKGKTQYAFYGISHFACKTEDCSEKGKEIYLSHCLNGYCEMEIDSRDSVKCKPNGLEAESCGWYVCNYCHSCCSSEQLQRRKWVYDNIMHSEYKCHLEGHRNLGVISCNKCGDPMEANETNIDEYNRILNWFVTNKDKSERIHKSGKNKRDKWWFTIRRGNDSMEEFRKKLTKYHQLGFQIPDFENDKDLQLISEPIDFNRHSKDILTCKTCGNILDLSNDLEKARAVKKFHNVRFVAETVE